MNMNVPEAREKRRAKAGAGSIGGYLGFFFGLLCVLSVASEIDPMPLGEAALTVLVCMIVGFVTGYVIQPFIAAWFPQA